jgi:hypothetical protein
LLYWYILLKNEEGYLETELGCLSFELTYKVFDYSTTIFCGRIVTWKFPVWILSVSGTLKTAATHLLWNNRRISFIS